MEQEKIYNQAVDGDEGFTAGDGYPSCEGQPCDNMADTDAADTDTLAGDEQSATTETATEAAADPIDAAAVALAEAQNEVAVWKDKRTTGCSSSGSDSRRFDPMTVSPV